MNKKLALGKSHDKVFVFSLFNLCLSGSAFYPALREEKFPSDSRCDFVLYHISIKQEWEELGVTVSSHEKKIGDQKFCSKNRLFNFSLSSCEQSDNPFFVRGGGGGVADSDSAKKRYYNSPFGSRFFNYNCLYRLRKRAFTAFT